MWPPIQFRAIPRSPIGGELTHLQEIKSAYSWRQGEIGINMSVIWPSESLLCNRATPISSILIFLLSSLVASSCRHLWSCLLPSVGIPSSKFFSSGIRNDYATTISSSYLTFYFQVTFRSLPVVTVTGNQWEQDRTFNLSIEGFLTDYFLSKFKAVFDTWLKSSNESRGLSLMIVHYTG